MKTLTIINENNPLDPQFIQLLINTDKLNNARHNAEKITQTTQKFTNDQLYYLNLADSLAL